LGKQEYCRQQKDKYKCERPYEKLIGNGELIFAFKSAWDSLYHLADAFSVISAALSNMTTDLQNRLQSGHERQWAVEQGCVGGLEASGRRRVSRYAHDSEWSLGPLPRQPPTISDRHGRFKRYFQRFHGIAVAEFLTFDVKRELYI
jgi:hypothetical protein